MFPISISASTAAATRSSEVSAHCSSLASVMTPIRCLEVRYCMLRMAYLLVIEMVSGVRRGLTGLMITTGARQTLTSVPLLTGLFVLPGGFEAFPIKHSPDTGVVEPAIRPRKIRPGWAVFVLGREGFVKAVFVGKADPRRVCQMDCV